MVRAEHEEGVEEVVIRRLREGGGVDAYRQDCRYLYEYFVCT